MIQSNINIIVLEPSAGMVLRNKNDIKVISKQVFLSINDSEENWEEIEESVALKEKEELEEQERLEKELEDRNNKYFE